jgi:hypothetical protein
MTPQTDLRERMQRVASKPARKSTVKPAAKPRVVTDTDLPVISVVPDVDAVQESAPVRAARRRAAAPRAARVSRPAPQAAVMASSRVATLLAWARWEVVEANAKRWEWLQGVVRGR